MIRLIQRVGLAAAIVFIPHGLWGQLTAAEKVPWGASSRWVLPLEITRPPRAMYLVQGPFCWRGRKSTEWHTNLLSGECGSLIIMPSPRRRQPCFD